MTGDLQLSGEKYISGESGGVYIHLLRAYRGMCALGDDTVPASIWGTSLDIKCETSTRLLRPYATYTYNIGNDNYRYNHLYNHNIYSGDANLNDAVRTLDEK